MQTNLGKLLKNAAPWQDWPNDWAFHHFVPHIITGEVLKGERLYQNVLMSGENGPEEKAMNLYKMALKNAILPYMDGTIASISRLTLPHIANIIQEEIKIRPLTYFRD